MAFNGSGIFNRLYTWVNDAAAAVKIRADRMDNEMNGFATGLTNCVTRDGQSPATANLPMGGFKHTGVADAAAVTEYAAFGQLLAKGVIYCPTVGGTASAITLSSGHSISAYAAGMAVSFIVGSSVTGATTVNLDGLGAKALTKRGSTALANLDIQAGWLVVAIYDGTRFQVISQRLCKSGDIDSGQVLTSNIGDSNVTTAKIADANVTYAKIQNVSATDKLLGRSTSGAGVVEEITCTSAGRAILDDADASAQRTTLGVYDEIVDSSYAQLTTYSNTTTSIPLDDTPPQSGEGISVLSVTHSAKTTTNKLRIRAVVPVGFNDTAAVAIGALFVGTGTVGASAVSAAAATCGNTSGMQSIILVHEYTPATTSSQTVEVRVGTGGSGGVGINGTNAARLFGGVTKATITVEEIRA